MSSNFILETFTDRIVFSSLSLIPVLFDLFMHKKFKNYIPSYSMYSSFLYQFIKFKYYLKYLYFTIYRISISLFNQIIYFLKAEIISYTFFFLSEVYITKNLVVVL